MFQLVLSVDYGLNGRNVFPSTLSLLQHRKPTMDSSDVLYSGSVVFVWMGNRRTVFPHEISLNNQNHVPQHPEILKVQKSGTVQAWLLILTVNE